MNEAPEVPNRWIRMVNEGTLSSENAAHERQQTVDAWVDVGGTFTDCFVRRSGHRLESCKVLSSGRVPLTLKNEIGSNDDSSRRVFTCPELSRDVEGFWCGADLLCLDEAGQVQGRLKVDSQRGGRITLSEVLHGSGARSADNASEVGLVGSLLERSGVEGFRLRFELDARIASPVLAVRRLLGVPLTNALPPLEVRLGTTRGTNALLTRTGAKTVFAVTAPFEDLLLIGDQTRPDLFALNIEKLEPLNELTIGIHERLAADGSVLLQLDESQARHELTQALESGGDSLAICLLHSPTNPAHEQRLAEIAREVGFRSISVSSELVPFIEILTRAQTTVLDAYLSPVVRRYLELLIDQFGSRVDLKLMTSAGGLVDWKRFRGKDCILSGPAGGVAALTKLAKTAETSALIGLDMGGTSTDVCRVTKRAADEPDDSESRGQQVETSDEYAADLQYESEKAGVKVVTPTLPIETVASGGGSICWFDGVRLRVGPQSAGAAPGPACYGRGGPLTVTDLNVYLGRVPAEQFPFPIDVDAIEFRLEELLEQLVRSDGNDGGITDRRSLCRGFRRLANEQMAEAVRTVSIRQGADPRQHALAGFGGAAGQHICEIADSLGITTIVDAPEAGLLSALGMGCADALLQKLLPVYQPLSEVDWGKLAVEVNLLQQGLLKQLAEDNGGSERAMSTSVLEMRFAGTDSTLPIECLIEEETSQYATSSVLSQRFHAAHRERFGYSREGQTIELVAIRCDVRLPGDFSWQSEALSSSEPKSAVEPSVDKWADSESVASALEVKAGDIRTLHRAEIPVEETVLGPCVILNSGSTFVLDGGWSAECQSSGILVATKVESPA
ncbi:MAG: hydantoinase/oxoprolinase family protein, partial [Pirellulaceae bacterium]